MELRHINTIEYSSYKDAFTTKHTFATKHIGLIALLGEHYSAEYLVERHL